MAEENKFSHRPGGYAYEHFHRGRQLRHLLFTSLMRWLMTLALAATIYAVLWRYSTSPPMPVWRKPEFNAITIGLSICLGLNIASSLKAMVSQLRWWLLSLGPSPPREADLILQSENVSRLVLLGWTTRRLPVRLFVLFWLALNVASQIGIAVLGLFYSINPSTMTQPGIVSVPDLSDIQTNKVLSSRSSRSSRALGALRYTANNYGIVALSYGIGTIGVDVPAPGSVFNPDNNLTFCDTGSCRYVFFESTPENSSFYSMVATNRHVSTSASCRSWRVLTGGDGYNASIVIADADRTRLGPLPALNGPDQTLYMHEPAEPAGDSWSVVSALEASTTDPWFYSCNVSVGPVINSVVAEHQLGVNVTRMAPAAIALQGYGASTAGVAAKGARQFQFQSYPAEVWYGLPLAGDTAAMALMMARFAIGVVAVTALSNSNTLVPGLVPRRAITIEISHWNYVYLILGLTVGVQAVVALVSVAIAHQVQVRRHSHLAMATLLRPTLQDVGARASAANGVQVAAMLGPDVRLVYVPRRGGGYGIDATNR